MNITVKSVRRESSGVMAVFVAKPQHSSEYNAEQAITTRSGCCGLPRTAVWSI